MRKLDNISENGKKLPFEVPNDYFDTLSDRVFQNVENEKQNEEKNIPWWVTLKPMLAFAAAFALLVIVSSLVFKYTLREDFVAESKHEESYMYSVLYIEEYIANAVGSDLTTDIDKEDIVDYLLYDNDINYLVATVY
ncbi:MAG: hypothetical protein LBH34_04860 [Prevotellaceae bacterium]|jgi:hypothetical protein|nr:hypothetical protein [Prevotellaceae bacterium]